MGIHDLRTSDQIDFVGGIRGLKELERRCEQDCVAAFALHPCEIGELLGIADEKMIMPPKSTWFEPKCVDGLCVKCFDWAADREYLYKKNYISLLWY